jgi:hypothetical protein
MLYKINFLDSHNVLLVCRDIFQALLPAISCCRQFVAGLRYGNVLLSNLDNSSVGPSLEGVFNNSNNDFSDFLHKLFGSVS